MCDQGEEAVVVAALEHVGAGAQLDRIAMGELGFFICERDLEEELIRAVGLDEVEDLVERHGHGGAYRSLHHQKGWQDLPRADVIHAFISRHKIEYAALLVDALDLVKAPQPLTSVLNYV